MEILNKNRDKKYIAQKFLKDHYNENINYRNFG